MLKMSILNAYMIFREDVEQALGVIVLGVLKLLASVSIFFFLMLGGVFRSLLSTFLKSNLSLQI